MAYAYAHMMPISDMMNVDCRWSAKKEKKIIKTNSLIIQVEVLFIFFAAEICSCITVLFV